MNGGIFCEPKISTTVYNSILIDEYHKCIFGDEEMQRSEKPCNAEPASNAVENAASNIEKWKVGMNVQAPSHYGKPGDEYYEAVIKNIKNDIHATVKFYGYDNEEVVRIADLKKSKGEGAIEEQIELATAPDYDEYEESDYDSEIDWKPGMKCRAYYEPNDVIYEATIESVDSEKELATVTLTGYDIKCDVEFHYLYKSDPSLREKQEISAAKYMAESRARRFTNPSQNVNAGIFKNDFKTINIPRPKIIPPMPEVSQSVRGCQPSQRNDTSAQPQNQGIMKPSNEKEAIACLVSANYLCGYYAGYLDCLKSKEDQPEHNH